jgi:hypothetical protein
MAEAFNSSIALPLSHPSIDIKELVIKLKAKISLFQCYSLAVIAASHIDSDYFVV